MAIRAAFLLLLLAQPLAAQQAATDSYLIPLLTRELPGAYGSIWQTQWMVANPNYNAPVTILAPTCADDGSVCAGTTLGPRTSVVPALAPRRDGAEGAFVHVPAGSMTAMALRVRDVSRNAQSFGTEIPIVHFREYTNQVRQLAWLLDIPTDPQYRATLRIYAMSEYPELALVQVTKHPSLELIEEHWIEMPRAGNKSDVAEADTIQKYPAYAQFDPLTPAVRAAGGRIAIAVTAAQWDSAISPPPLVPIWAFVSITDITTQQFTTVTPHQ